jgi:multicomponent Na+:H+ antiporter subunit D
VRPASRTLPAVLLAAVVPSLVFGLAPGLLFALVPGGANGYAPYAVDEIAKGLAVTAVGIVGFAVLRRPLSRVPAVDVDRVLHPVALQTARGLALGTVAVGRLASTTLGEAMTALTTRIGPDDRPANVREQPLGTTLLVVTAGLGFALLLAQLV